MLNSTEIRSKDLLGDIYCNAFSMVHIINKIQKKKYPRFFLWKCSKLGLSLSEAKELQENTLILSTHFFYRTYIFFTLFMHTPIKRLEVFFGIFSSCVFANKQL